MIRTRIVFAFLAIACARAAPGDEPAGRDLYADTWVATDAIGRTMPGIAEAGPVKDDRRRIAGIFYITWHRDPYADFKSPYTADVTHILETDPDARFDADHPLWTEHMYHWGEPEYGYFLSKDAYVVRQDMSMLSDAGVDVIVMDVTNAVLYWDEWEVVFGVMQDMHDNGVKAPRFCFWSFNGPSITVVQELYDKVYAKGRFKDLWFYWDGKPLLLYNGSPMVDANGADRKHPNPHYEPAAGNDPDHPGHGNPKYTDEFFQDYTDEVKAFFTLRTMWWGYYEWAGERFVGTEDKWSFGYNLGDKRVQDMSPAELLSTHDGEKEQFAVTPAQHSVSLIGKSWTREHGEPALNEYDMPVPAYVPWLGKTVENPEAYGIYFQARWDEAIEADPQFLYINDWNEWTAGKYHPDEGKTYNFMRRESPYRFVDQYNAEFNRGIQPMKGGYADNYYMQMAQNIRRYKGVRPIPQLRGARTMTIDGDFADWTAVETEYRDTLGDTAHRDYPGYGGLHYTNDSGRNDIVTCKVAVDGDTVYFHAETAAPLTPHTDANWMWLLIDADTNHDTGWYGYDFLVNRKPQSEQATTVAQYDKPNARWVNVGEIAYRYAGDAIELAVPRDTLGLNGDALTFDFHWIDNAASLEDPISLCTHGDSAPNRRFNYRCIWTE